MSPEILMTVGTARSVALDRISSGSRPHWTISEVGIACGGLAPQVFDAALFTYAGDESVRRRLSQWLLEWALARRAVYRWPRRVATLGGEYRPFLSNLCDLWLCEVRAPCRFRRFPNRPNMRRIAMDVSESVWSNRLLPVYGAIASEFCGWLNEADEMIERRTRGR